MNLLKLLLTWITILIPFIALSQTCTVLGQNPATAFPVCGTSVFQQNNVPLCGNRTVPSTCTNAVFSDKNPFWYKFTCYKSGTLGFVITPNNMADDYDWQLYDVTGKDYDKAVYSDPSSVIASNWSGDGGLTGTSASAGSLVVCAGYGQPLYSRMPQLTEGREYLLLVSHFTNTQSGYKLEFKGGTANITDPLPPRLSTATSTCDGTKAMVKLNKKMKCNSLASNGSDFELFPAVAGIKSVAAPACTGSFDMDSVIVTFDKALPPGNYSLIAKTGTDGNTILDNCQIGIPEGDKTDFTVFPIQPTPMDSIRIPECAPVKLNLVFRSPLKCSSVTANGSEFTISGPSAAEVTGARILCTNESGTELEISLRAPIKRGGIYTLELKNGSDGNTLLDECGQATPAGSRLAFRIADTVNADFKYQITRDCAMDLVNCLHDGNNGVNEWNWTISDGSSGRMNAINGRFTTEGPHSIKLAVSNGICRDSSEVIMVFGERVKADFEGPEVICPTDNVQFENKSTGPVLRYSWDFGNGSFSSMETPAAQRFVSGTRVVNYDIKLVVADGEGCTDTLIKKVEVVNSCVIAVPSAFSPNDDGRNDKLFPTNAWKATNLEFRVYNRYGQMVFETKDWTKQWDGRVNGQLQSPGTYVWILQYTLRDTGTRHTNRGTTVLIR